MNRTSSSSIAQHAQADLPGATQDRLRFAAVAHRDHTFTCPLSSERADRLLGLMDLQPGQRVLDIGCGKAELLLRAIERYRVGAVGIDRSAQVLEQARQAAALRTPLADLTLHELDVASFSVPEGSFDAALCIAGPYGIGEVRALARMVKPGGLVLLGDHFWQAPPPPEYLAFLGTPHNVHADHETGVKLGLQAGLRLLYACTATLDEWDHYEGLYLRAVELHVAQNPDDADAAAMRARMDAWRDAYYRWGRQALGFAFYLFRK